MNKYNITNKQKQVQFLSETHIALQNLLIECNIRFKHVYLSQQKIADRLGLSVRHVKRLVRDLRNFGFIETIYQGFKKTLIYIIPDFMREQSFIDQYWGIFPLLRMPSKIRFFIAKLRNVPQVIIRNISISKTQEFILNNLEFLVPKRMSWLDKYREFESGMGKTASLALDSPPRVRPNKKTEAKSLHDRWGIEEFSFSF